MKRIVIIAGVFILLLSITAGVYLVQQRTQLRGQAVADTALLSFVPGSANANPAQEISFDVTYDRRTGTRAAVITGADLYVSVDNANVTIVRFTPDAASRFNTELKNEITNNGQSLRYTGVNTAEQPLPTNQVTVLGRLTVQAAAAGSSILRFDASSQIVASGYKDAVPLDLRTATVTVGGPLPSASPTAPPVIACVNGDVTAGAFHNGCVDQNDYNVWLREFRGEITTKTADFYTECNANNQKGDGVINISDYNIWLREFNAGRNRCQ